MSQKPNIKFPVPLLILDVIGTLLLAAGIFGQFGDDNVLTPYALPLIIVGAALMLPLLVNIVVQIGKRN